MRLAIREDGAAFAEAERRGGGRDGLKVDISQVISRFLVLYVLVVNTELLNKH